MLENEQPDRESELSPKALQESLREERAARDVVTHLAMHLNMPCDSTEKDCIPDMLKYLGRTFGFGRVFLSVLDGTVAHRLYEWTGPGIPFFRPGSDEIAFDCERDLAAFFCRTPGQYVYIDSDSGWDHLPPRMISWFKETGADSTIVFYAGRHGIGPAFVGFECHGERQVFTPRYRELLRTVVDILIIFYTRVRAEVELRESERFLRMAQGVAGLACWEIAVGKYKKTIGKCFDGDVVPDGIRVDAWEHAFDEYAIPYDERVRAVVEDAWRTGEPFVLEAMIRDGDGIDRWVEVRAQPRIGEGDDARIYGTTQNIDSRKKIERKLRDVNAKLDDLARRDSLTGLLNKREFEKDIHNLCVVFERIKRPLSLIMFDIDHFKQYNDTYGHLAGDDCLRRIGEAIISGLQRDADSAYRYGGEEFTVILPDTNPDGAARVAEKIRQSVQKLAIPHEKSSSATVVTASVGFATTNVEDGVKPVELVSNADAALYRAKRAGRNRISP
ncbi:MAG TPA: hypothetical protein DEB39_16300 [Planctomycetaceae bacterium]|nr:hypothetical protein [Planctomycetaceae bacterium]